MSIFKRYKIYDNEKCPCGSGKRYFECCKNRKDKVVKDKIPLDVKIVNNFRGSLFKCCMYPDKTKCVKHIKNAHALQNNKIISALAVDGHVCMLNHKKKPIIVPIENNEVEVLTLVDYVGVNHATTFNCFCDVHDDEVFAPIEKGAPDFDINSAEQKYLYAYKAFIFEYYKEKVHQRSLQKIIKEKPSILKEKFFIKEFRNLNIKLNEMESIKTFFDNGLVNRDFSGVQTCVVTLPEAIKFANYSYIGLNYDLKGKKIKNIKNNFMHPLFLTIFPEKNQSYIIIGCLDKHKKTYDKFLKQLNSCNIDVIKYYFTLVLPLYSENIVLSPTLWESWNEKIQMAFTFYCNRQGSQFTIYNTIVKWGLKNLKRKNINLKDGNRGKIDLFI
ncbi:SEC-C motif-containing protein [Clostridium neonatale]|uniref:SEC-C domain-containing protein n=1 Tax=Clostridium neonatale TaxID=137838 RepID=UPI00291BEB88|nr:SEC-C domain-containing protein [Clostridium neonatale]CAI3550203.1 SEC-C motif-containing protein [Clostridium neonatale]